MNSKSIVWMVRAAALTVAACVSGSQAGDGLRIATWNISNYNGGRTSDIQTAVYGTFDSRSMSPDVLVCQEVLSLSGMNALVSILNSAPGSPGDWQAGPFIDGPDTDSALLYRASKVVFLGVHTLPADPGTTGAPRDVRRYDIGLVGYAALSTQLSMYSVHMKAGSGSTDQARRLIEARRIRDDAELLDPAINIMVLGDFNIQSSSQSAYIELTGFQANNNGRFFDPIATPGSWNNNSSFRFVHTQDPSGAGGMDDRHDQILVDEALGDGAGLEYIGLFGVPYATTTWDDPNHSYRSWGNDGSSYNTSLTTNGNTMVGPAIAIALRNVAAGGGHLPVFLDLRVPGKITADTTVDLGEVPFGSVVAGELAAGNGGDVGLWGPAGISDVTYSLDADAGLSINPGPYLDSAGGSLNTHTFQADLADDPGGGSFSADIRVLSDDPDVPVLTVHVIGTVVGCHIADMAVPFGTLDFFDALAFLDAFAQGLPAADLNGDGVLDFFDVLEFSSLFAAGCP